MIADGRLAIADVVLGDRVRKDMGDLAALAASIAAHGLLHPIVVTPAGVLIAGHRRLEAVKLLEWTRIPATVLDVADLLAAERDENAVRKDFTPTEAVAIGRLIEEKHREKIEAVRHVANSKAGKASALKRNGISTTAIKEEHVAVGHTDVVAAKAVGMSESTYFRARAVVAAAEADPERFGDLPERMDETGNVSGTHREMQRREAAPAPSKKKPRHAVHGRTHYPRPNREIERSIFSLTGICTCLAAIEPDQLEPSRVREWSKQLKAAAAAINQFARRIHVET